MVQDILGVMYTYSEHIWSKKVHKHGEESNNKVEHM